MSSIKTVLILGVTLGAAYFIYKYMMDDAEASGCTDGEEECISGVSFKCVDGKLVLGGDACDDGGLCNLTDSDKCIDGRLFDCQTVGDVNKWVDIGSCTEPIGYVCPTCASYDCVQSFDTPDALTQHKAECHYSLLDELYPLHREWKWDGVSDRPVILRYFLCQTYRLRDVAGSIKYKTIDDNPVNHYSCASLLVGGCCDCYIKVYYWHPTTGRTLLREWGIPRSGYASTFYDFIFSCDVYTDMIEFELYGRGSLCADLGDPQFLEVKTDFSFDRTPLSVPKVCTSSQVGWRKFLVRPPGWVDSGPPILARDSLPLSNAYHTGEAEWCIIDDEARPC